MFHIAIFGPPGAGKGTQKGALIERYDLEPIAPGDIFRAAVAKATPLGREVQKYIDEGQFVPEHLTIQVVEEHLASHKKGTKFLFDGFPRSLLQAEALDRLMKEYHNALDLVLFLDVDEGELLKRIAKRSLLGRPDDQDPEKVRRRLELYHHNTLPVADYYERQDKLVRVPGHHSIERVATLLEEAIKVRFSDFSYEDA